MGTDENRPLPPSARPVERADLPPGPGRDLRDAIYHLYAQADCPRLDRLADKIAEDAEGDLPGAPRKDVVGKIISGDQVGSQQDTISVAVALSRAGGEVHIGAIADKIRQLWVAARTAPIPARPVRLGRPIPDCDPLALEVHRAVDVPNDRELPELPAYVERRHDRLLRQIADEVLAGGVRMITLVGGSSTGKTRACWELAQYIERKQPGRWRLWHPYDPARADAAAVELERVSAYTIVWLNEAQLYLAPPEQRLGERVAARLRTLRHDSNRQPVLILATLWQQHWIALTSRPDLGLADPHAQAREALTGTDVDVPVAFSPADLIAADISDPRLRQAIKRAEGGQLTEAFRVTV